MIELNFDGPHWEGLKEEHRRWLAQFDQAYVDQWDTRLNADCEAALCEASFRRRLANSGVVVTPNESPSSGGPDFRCTRGNEHFYVEVTCILIETAKNKSGIEWGRNYSFGPVNASGLTQAVFAECRGKAQQCADMDGPTLVAIGTFHVGAAMYSFQKLVLSDVLTGQTSLGWTIDKATGEPVSDTYLSTELKSAAFLRPDRTQGIGYARDSISGLLIYALESTPDHVIGVLHPNPIRRFDSRLLPDIEFGEVRVDPPSKHLDVFWPRGHED